MKLIVVLDFGVAPQHTRGHLVTSRPAYNVCQSGLATRLPGTAWHALLKGQAPSLMHDTHRVSSPNSRPLSPLPGA